MYFYLIYFCALLPCLGGDAHAQGSCEAVARSTAMRSKNWDSLFVLPRGFSGKARLFKDLQPDSFVFYVHILSPQAGVGLLKQKPNLSHFNVLPKSHNHLIRRLEMRFYKGSDKSTTEINICIIHSNGRYLFSAGLYEDVPGLQTDYYGYTKIYKRNFRKIIKKLVPMDCQN